MSNNKFLHIPPTCILLMPSTTGNGGAYFKAVCTKCPDEGLECNADGSSLKCFNCGKDGWMLTYDEPQMELEAMLLAMNGGSLLEDWKESRRVGEQ
jgi:hypothetical protein